MCSVLRLSWSLETLFWRSFYTFIAAAIAGLAAVFGGQAAGVFDASLLESAAAAGIGGGMLAMLDVVGEWARSRVRPGRPGG